MKDHELDRILATEEELAPSPRFASTVMSAVRSEMSAPPPIPFPWKIALPGLVSCIMGLVAMCAAAFLQPAPPAVPQPSGPSFWMGLVADLNWVLGAAHTGGLGWILLALLMTLASVKLSLRLIQPRN